MPRSLEIEDTTLEDAVDRALRELGAARDDVEVEVLDATAETDRLDEEDRPVRVRVTMRDETGRDAPPADDPPVEAPPAEPAAPPRRRPRARRNLTGRDGPVRRSRGPRRVKKEKPEDRAPAPAVAARPVREDPPAAPDVSPSPVRDESAEGASPAAPTPAREDAPRDAAPAEGRQPGEGRGPSRRGRDRDRGRRPERPRRGREAAREAGRASRGRRRQVSEDAFTHLPGDVVQELLELIGCEADLHGQAGAEAYEVDIDADDTSLLIGRRGQNLESLQYIVNRICNRGREEPTPIMLDVAGYRQRRIETLEALAESLADKVARTRRPISMEPLPPHERRIIHLILRDDEDVETFSRGEGDERYLVIAPRRGRG